MSAASPKLEVAQIMGYLLSVAIKVVDHCIEVGTKCSIAALVGRGQGLMGVRSWEYKDCIHERTEFARPKSTRK